MGNYYCMMTGLPDIKLDSKLEVSYAALREELDSVLSDNDKKLMEYFFLETDCKNLVRILKNPEAAIEVVGNYSKEELQDLIASALEMEDYIVPGFPAFMSKFVRSYNYNKDKEGFFAEDEIMLAFYEYAQRCPNATIRDWYYLNQDINNILTAFIARKYGWNVGDLIKGENDVTEMIRINTSKDFNLSREYDHVNALMQIVDCEDPVDKEKRIDALKWLWLDNKTFFDSFSIEAVFAYFCKVAMLIRWDKLDVEKGQATFRQIIEDLRGEATVPEEFTTYMPKGASKS